MIAVLEYTDFLDVVLEDAAEVVLNYRQKGGE
jgi:hypothetical protein